MFHYRLPLSWHLALGTSLLEEFNWLFSQNQMVMYVSDDDDHDVGDDHDDIGARTCARLSTDPPTRSLEPFLFCIGSGINDFCQCFSQKLDKPSTIWCWSLLKNPSATSKEGFHERIAKGMTDTRFVCFCQYNSAKNFKRWQNHPTRCQTVKILFSSCC